MIRTIKDKNQECKIDLETTTFYLRNIINEEYGIASSVEDMTQVIKKTINNCIKTKKPTEITAEYSKLMVYKKLCAHSDDNSGRFIEFSMQCVIYDFNNEDNYKDFCEKKLPQSSYNPLTHSFFINIASFKRQLLSDAMMVIQHEVTHCYETAVNNDRHAMSANEHKMYNTIKEVLLTYRQLKEQNDGYLKLYKMADAIYSSFRIEMNAFANGLDAVIRNSAYDWELKVQESDTYSKFNNICTCLKNMDEYFNIIYNCLKNENETLDETIFRYLGMTPNRIKIMLMKGKQELARKIGRVIARNQLSESKHMLF